MRRTSSRPAVWRTASSTTPLPACRFADDWCAASIHDPASGCTVTQRWDDAFRECVVYTPPHREAICIEPLTCVPSCFELTARGIDAGLRVVPPGGSFAARVEIGVSVVLTLQQRGSTRAAA